METAKTCKSLEAVDSIAGLSVVTSRPTAHGNLHAPPSHTPLSQFMPGRLGWTQMPGQRMICPCGGCAPKAGRQLVPRPSTNSADRLHCTALTNRKPRGVHDDMDIL